MIVDDHSRRGGHCGMNVAACCAYFRDSLVTLLVQDLERWGIKIHLWALESTLPSVAPLTRGGGPLGKSQALNRLLPHVADADVVLFVDDDVRLGPTFLPTYLAIFEALGAAVAQPALTAGSYFNVHITLERKGRWARLTNFVEVGPVVSMSRDFLNLVTPFPETNPMGWGLDYQWSAIARSRGLRMAIVDACPVEHNFRSIGARYPLAGAIEDMERFLAEGGLTPIPVRVERDYPRIYDRREDYVRAFPAPPEAVDHGIGSDMEQDLPLLWAVTSLVRPETIVELGTRWGTSTRTLVHAARQWGGRVVTADPVDARPSLGDLPCEFVHGTGEAFYDGWATPVGLLFIDTDPHTYDQTRLWLDTWVKTWLADGGVAVFHDVIAARPEIRVAEAVRDWLREQPHIWRWQEFAGTWGLGLLWRTTDAPDFEGLVERYAQGIGPAPVPRSPLRGDYVRTHPSYNWPVIVISADEMGGRPASSRPAAAPGDPPVEGHQRAIARGPNDVGMGFSHGRRRGRPQPTAEAGPAEGRLGVRGIGKRRDGSG